MTRLILRLAPTAIAITVLLALQQAPSSRAGGFNTGMLYRYPFEAGTSMSRTVA